jgi:hypothetical protein
LFVIVLETQVIIIRVAKGGHVDLMIRRVMSCMAVLEYLCATVSLFRAGRERFALLKVLFLHEGHKVGVVIE